ncbi:MAG: hypothetical protein U1E52_07730 [Geminicoccaceae bacterium]
MHRHGRCRRNDQDPALLIGPDRPCPNTNRFLDKLVEPLKARMGA